MALKPERAALIASLKPNERLTLHPAVQKWTGIESGEFVRAEKGHVIVQADDGRCFKVHGGYVERAP